jgi:hypothetical protein
MSIRLHDHFHEAYTYQCIVHVLNGHFGTLAVRILDKSAALSRWNLGVNNFTKGAKVTFFMLEKKTFRIERVD